MRNIIIPILSAILIFLGIYLFLNNIYMPKEIHQDIKQIEFNGFIVSVNEGENKDQIFVSVLKEDKGIGIGFTYNSDLIKIAECPVTNLSYTRKE